MLKKSGTSKGGFSPVKDIINKKLNQRQKNLKFFEVFLCFMPFDYEQTSPNSAYHRTRSGSHKHSLWFSLFVPNIFSYPFTE